MNDRVQKGDRIAKVIARAGFCSRRDAEKWIADGRISVNGKTITSPALNIIPSDRVIVDGKPLSKESSKTVRLFRYYKPTGLVTTHKDEKGRPTVFENLPEDLPRVISVGRLDLNSEGLLLLSNDGDLSRHLEMPSTGWTRRYRVRAYGRIEQATLDRLAHGITIEDVRYGPIKAVIDQTQGDNTWMTVSLTEGKNREIRRVMAHLDLQVNRLIRLSYGPFQLGNLKKGHVEEIPLKAIKDQIPAFFKQDK